MFSDFTLNLFYLIFLGIAAKVGGVAEAAARESEESAEQREYQR